jgi:hypothetical protein
MARTPLEELRRRAALGEPSALDELAWEYFRGEVVAKDIASATALLRQLELMAPEFARFNLAKIKYLEGDSSFVDDIRQDCAAGYGPALYLMGVYSLRKIGGDKGRIEALQYFRAAAQNGHLPSELEFWRHSKLGLWRRLATVIPIHRTLVRVVVLRRHNRNDTRILV